MRLRALVLSAVIALTTFIAVTATPADAAPVPPGFVDTLITTSLSSPTALAVAPDGRVFVTEQGGNVRVVKNGALLGPSFVSLSVDSAGERGLIGITLDPNFSSNGFVYVYYTVPGSPPHNRVSRFTASGDVAVPGSQVNLVDLPGLDNTNHNGGGIHFAPDGTLLIGVGENGHSDRSQTLSSPFGKILRVDALGNAPANNPFFNTPGADQRVWALGLRNPYTFNFQPGTGRIYINDVGASTWEEIDEAFTAGMNFGWPITEGPTNDRGSPHPASRRAWTERVHRVRDHGRRVLQPPDAAVPERFRRRLLLCRPVQRLDPSSRRRHGNGAIVCTARRRQRSGRPRNLP